MARSVAFLGSINVGGNTLKMDALRDALEGDGFANVATVIASGNVLFDSVGAEDVALERRMEKLIAERFGIASFAAVRARAELAATIAGNPFAGDGDEGRVHAHFLERQPEPEAFEKLVADHARHGRERLALGDRALYIDYVDGAGRSKLNSGFIERRLGCRGTARNMRSLARILARMD
ncbi:MAG: DUF1697 domain-containing protein [Novosphingobium sp.]|nr:DUF1697 domain-containing protein [Novosphingobium sp.]